MSLDLPTFTNGGLIVLGLLVLALVAMLAPHPCPWRCDTCSARFPTESMLTDHEARHTAADACILPFESCDCSHDRVFHASGVGDCDRPGCGCRSFHLLNQRIA